MEGLSSTFAGLFKCENDKSIEALYFFFLFSFFFLYIYVR